MCGITVFLSKKDKNVINQILKSLSIIQNRGYDSVGIAMKSKIWEIYKHASTEISDGINTLTKTMDNKSSTIAIGHTRWATHGGKTDENSHPHCSMHGNIILVHNGIINNFQEIKNFLILKDFKFYSETDTEVIANLIEYYLLNNNTIYEAIEYANNLLNGTWALAIIYTLEPDKILLTRHGSPLILGYNDDLIICTSEISGFIGLVYNYIILDNHDIITISEEGYQSNNTYTTKSVNTMTIVDSPDPYKHWTIKEINDQPKSIMAAFNNGARILNNNINLSGLNQLREMLHNTKIDHLIVIGCGTSYHASMFAKFYFNSNNSNTFTSIQAFDASEFDINDIPKSGKVLCIICSQSGETRDLIKCIDICKTKNCILIGVVNVVDSVIARMVECGVYLNAGQEIAVASTKSFTSMLIVLSLIGMWFKDKHINIPIINTLRSLPNIIENFLSSQKFKTQCEKIVEFINENEIHSIFILGRGKMFPISREIALKLKELTYIHAEGYSGGSLKHGPFAVLDKKTLTILLVDKKNIELSMSTYYEITSRDTHSCVVSDSNLVDIKCDYMLQIPKISHYQEILFSIALQYLSYILSVSRSINPDKPRNLAKVVTVE